MQKLKVTGPAFSERGKMSKAHGINIVCLSDEIDRARQIDTAIIHDYLLYTHVILQLRSAI